MDAPVLTGTVESRPRAVLTAGHAGRRQSGVACEDLALPAGADDQSTPAVTVVVATRNDAANVADIITRIQQGLGSTTAEILFVDDSDDNTPELIRAAAGRLDRPVRLLHRGPGERAGRMAGAVVAGLHCARGHWAVVLEGGVQHPPEGLPALIAAGVAPGVELVYGSRHFKARPVPDPGGPDQGGPHRVDHQTTWQSTFSRVVVKALFPRKLRGVTDPMSAFFAVRLDALNLPELRPFGSKVLLEILTGRQLSSVVSVPISWQPAVSRPPREKLARRVHFLVQLLALRLSMSVPRLTQLASFLAIGVSGVVVNTVALWLLSGTASHMPYLWASLVATNVAVLWNFVLLEKFVFHQTRSRSFWAGLARFWLVSMVLLPVQLGLLALFVEMAGVPPIVANLVVLAIVFALRYLLTSTWVYSWNAAQDDGVSAAKP